jgi:hypothetical protein
VLPEQEALPHWTEVAACWQAPAPSQAAVLPQGGLAAQRAWGSVAPAVTLTQTPLAPQTWQVGQLATPQQTPSTQLLVPHSWAAPQAAPELFLGRQLPLVPVQ